MGANGAFISVVHAPADAGERAPPLGHPSSQAVTVTLCTYPVAWLDLV